MTSLLEHPHLPADAAADLLTVSRVLRRLERSSAAVLPWLMADNAANAALLAQLLPALPADVAADADAALEASQDPGDVSGVEARSEQLRSLLARAVVASTDHPGGEKVRRRIAGRLTASLDDRPW